MALATWTAGPAFGIDLAPCGHCGSGRLAYFCNGTETAAHCANCGASTALWPTKELARAAWNARFGSGALAHVPALPNTLDCLHCGECYRLAWEEVQPPFSPAWQIVCHNCGASTGGRYREDAHTAWNARLGSYRLAERNPQAPRVQVVTFDPAQLPTPAATAPHLNGAAPKMLALEERPR